MKVILVLGAVGLSLAGQARAADIDVTLSLKDHRFIPAAIDVPAGKSIRVRLINQDGALEEFDSQDLGVERDVTPYGETVFNFGPLKPGVYTFVGELHAGTASGAFHAVTHKDETPN